MKDYVLAIYHREYYAGEEILILVKVFTAIECAGKVPEEYNTPEYIFKCMTLCEIESN